MKVTRGLLALFMVAAGSLTAVQPGWAAASRAGALDGSGTRVGGRTSPARAFFKRRGAILDADQANAQFGYSVASAGDVNGDGFNDVIVGARAYDNGESNEGRAYVYLGSAS